MNLTRFEVVHGGCGELSAMCCVATRHIGAINPSDPFTYLNAPTDILHHMRFDLEDSNLQLADRIILTFYAKFDE